MKFMRLNYFLPPPLMVNSRFEEDHNDWGKHFGSLLHKVSALGKELSE